MKAMVTSWMSGLLLLLNLALPQSGRAQDTLFPGSLPSLSMQEQLKILEQAYKEQFKNYPMQMDSLLTQSSIKLKKLITDTAMLNTFQQGFQIATLRAKEMLSDTALWNQQQRLLKSLFTDTTLWNQQKKLLNNLLIHSSSVINSQFEALNKVDTDSLVRAQSELFGKLFSSAGEFSTGVPYGSNSRVGRSSSSTLPFQGESTTKELSVKVDKAVSVLTLTLKGEVESGRIKLEIIDPEGKVQGGYTIEGNGKGRKEPVSGVSVKQYPSPAIGVWIVKVVSNKAVGTVTLISNQKP